MRKSDKLDISKSKLIEATMELMDACVNPIEVTSRTIASKAGVQVAMINYCFGSREGLIFEAFSMNKDKYMKELCIDSVENSSKPPKEILRSLHYKVAEFLIREYKYTSAITAYVLLHRDLSQKQSSLPLVMAHYSGSKSEEECKLISYELSSTMQLAINRYEDIKILSGFDLTNIEELHRFIDIQFDLFLVD